MKNIEFKSLENQNKFILSIDDNEIVFQVLSSDFKLIGELDDIYIYEMAEDFKAVFEKVDSKIVLTFYFESNNKNLNLHVENLTSLLTNDNFYILKTKNSSIKINNIDCKVFENHKTISINIFKNQASLIFEENTNLNLNNQVFSSFLAAEDPENIPPVEIIVPGGNFTTLVDDDVFHYVSPFTRGPEFSLGIFDLDGEPTISSGGKRPRPVRLGVPVISMVPAYSNSLPEDDAFYFSKGVGPQFRDMYFRVVCNQEIKSQTVKLLIYMPNGLDTISSPDAIVLKKISANGSNSVYHGKYTFFEEDSIYSIDGFVYFSVYLDIIQQVALPVESTSEDYVAPDVRQNEREMY